MSPSSVAMFLSLHRHPARQGFVNAFLRFVSITLALPAIDAESSSPYEREVIEHPSSCYVLGRSGTGYVFLAKLLSVH